ncbi:MAG TPA: hypothetical protein VHB50_13090, partial [Bryobacteraceae bacterium]|nr:hypothetical protein [Bryobacteraceae bacterium]
VTPLLESVARLIECGQLSRDSICINLVGEALPGCIPSPDFVDRAKSEGWLDLSGKVVSQKEAQRISQTSDGLLLIQPHSSIQVPGKIFEYVQIGRPVLAFVPEDSPIERILAQSGITYRCVYTDQSNERMDEQLLDFFRLPSTVSPPNAWFEEQFDGCRQVEALDRYIREILE